MNIKLSSVDPSTLLNILFPPPNQEGKMSENKKSTIIEDEIKLFTEFGSIWWNAESIVKSLHTLNDLRVPLVKNTLQEMGVLKEENVKGPFPLKGIKILDAGCGGGLFSEPLAKLGAEVTGVDPTEELIKVAREHASLDKNMKLEYVLSTVEEFALKNEGKFDCVVSSEVLEHITEIETFLEGCVKCLKPGGSLLVSTYNKTPLGFLIGIVLVEYIFSTIPRGSHSYSLFVKPETVSKILDRHNCKTKEVKGCFINPHTFEWSYMLPSVHYFLHAIK